MRPPIAFVCILSVMAFFLGAQTARAADQPDLVPELRSVPYQGQVAPVYIDAYEQPGKLLYRFDAIIRNRGGTLDIFRDPGTGSATQAVWLGGEPSEAPDPNRPPSSSDATRIDIGARGARFDYVFERTHSHWHFFTAGRYSLELPGGGKRVSDKVGFCLFDGFGSETSGRWFLPGSTGSGTQTWCGFDHPDGTFVRMGLSPGAADRYASQREFQWVDISGLRAGRYTVLAEVNPYGHIEEADRANNAVRESRLIPGVIAAAVTTERSRNEVETVELSAGIVAPEVPARRSAACEPAAGSTECYVRASASGPLTFRITEQPMHGSVTLAAQEGTTATAHYRSAPGYAGEDSFSYTATDARGLTSPPASVRIRSRSQTAPITAPPGSGSQTQPPTANVTPTATTTPTTTTTPARPTATVTAAQLRGQIAPAAGKAKSIAVLLKRGGYVLRFTAPGAGVAVVKWYFVPAGAKLAEAKPVLVASGRRTLTGAMTVTVKLKLTPAGKRLLKGAARLRLTARGSFTPAGGVAASATKTFTLRR